MVIQNVKQNGSKREAGGGRLVEICLTNAVLLNQRPSLAYPKVQPKRKQNFGAWFTFA